MKITKENLGDVFKSKVISVELMELKGYILIDELFVDSSGFGCEGEPALTKSQFEQKLLAIVEQEKAVYTSITNVGQFQVYVGIFKKGGAKKAKKIKNNTYKIDLGGDDYAIRLHNTDILTFKGGKYVLDSGGWQTRTTKERLNEFLPNGYYISQKNYKWYVETPEGGKLEFLDGMAL